MAKAVHDKIGTRHVDGGSLVKLLVEGDEVGLQLGQPARVLDEGLDLVVEQLAALLEAHDQQGREPEHRKGLKSPNLAAFS